MLPCKLITRLLIYLQEIGVTHLLQSVLWRLKWGILHSWRKKTPESAWQFFQNQPGGFGLQVSIASIQQHLGSDYEMMMMMRKWISSKLSCASHAYGAGLRRLRLWLLPLVLSTAKEGWWTLYADSEGKWDGWSTVREGPKLRAPCI